MRTLTTISPKSLIYRQAEHLSHPCRQLVAVIRLVWTGFFCVCASANAGAEAVPGGIHVATLPAETRSASYQGHRVLILDGNAIVGIALNAMPGSHTLTVVDKHGHKSSQIFVVNAKQYSEQHLTIANPLMVNPAHTDLQRINAESARMRKGYLNFIGGNADVRPLAKPIAGITSSPFGRRRILNGQPRNPHSGLDIAAATGTPVEAPAPASVTLTGDFYFNGNTIFLDHGQGLVTMYCHLSQINVSEGDSIARGDIIGLVGATGRATGPHLHWSVSLNGNRVDPVLAMTILAAQPPSGTDD